jgi:The  BURPS668_1122 family of deaminases
MFINRTEVGFSLFTYQQKNEKNEVVATYYICRHQIAGEYHYTYYSKSNSTAQAQEVADSFQKLCALQKSKADEGWIGFKHSLPLVAAATDFNLFIQNNVHKDDVAKNSTNALNGQKNADLFAKGQASILRAEAIANIKGRKIQAQLDLQNQIKTRITQQNIGNDIANQNGINLNILMDLDNNNISEAEIAEEVKAIIKQKQDDEQKFANLQVTQAKLDEANLKELQNRTQRPADPKIGTTAVDNVYTKIEQPRVDFKGLSYLFKKTVEDNGWLTAAGLLIVGFSPAGAILDAVELMAALATGDIGGIIMSSIGFLPGGDFIKAYRKSEKALENANRAATGAAGNIVSNIDAKTVSSGLTNNNITDKATTEAATGVKRFDEVSNPAISKETPAVTSNVAALQGELSKKVQILSKAEMNALLDKDASKLSQGEKKLVEAYKKQVQGKKTQNTAENVTAPDELKATPNPKIEGQIRGIKNLQEKVENAEAKKHIDILLDLHKNSADELKKLSSFISALNGAKDATTRTKLLQHLDNATKNKTPLPTAEELKTLTTIPKVKPQTEAPVPITKNPDHKHWDTEANIKETGLKNTRIANPEERLAAETHIKNFETEQATAGVKLDGKNLGYIEGEITRRNSLTGLNDEHNPATKIQTSVGENELTNLQKAQFFNTKTVDKGNNIHPEGVQGVNAWSRTRDSEYLMLTRLVFDMQAKFPKFVFKQGQIYDDIVGDLKIISTNPYCISCQDVIKQFNTAFPNINLILIDNIKKTK